MTFTRKLIALFGSVALASALFACSGADGEPEGEGAVGQKAEAFKVVCTNGQPATQMRRDNDPRCTGSQFTGTYIDYYCGTSAIGGACEKRFVAPPTTW